MRCALLSLPQYRVQVKELKVLPPPPARTLLTLCSTPGRQPLVESLVEWLGVLEPLSRAARPKREASGGPRACVCFAASL